MAQEWIFAKNAQKGDGAIGFNFQCEKCDYKLRASIENLPIRRAHIAAHKDEWERRMGYKK